MAGSEVLVVGSGVIGLTTAVVLAEGGHRVRVVTREPAARTTSAVAGALWEPYLAEPRHQVAAWAHRTFSVLTELAATPGTGVALVEGTKARRSPGLDAPWWAADHPGLVRPATPGELPDGFRSGFTATLPLVDMGRYLAYLTGRLERAGGVIEAGTVTSLTDLAARVVVNCTGLGARELVPDPLLRPILGHLVVVANTPGLTRWFVEAEGGDEGCYIFPHAASGVVVLGGTAYDGRTDTRPDPRVAAGIVERCSRVVPGLADAPVVAHRVGLRPARPHIRLERELLPTGAVCVHSYGHGGCGVTVSWACAADVAALLA